MSVIVYGRPPGITTNAAEMEANIPLAVDDAYIKDGVPQPQDLPSKHAFLGAKVKLYLMVDDVMEKMRKCRLEDSRSGSGSDSGSRSPSVVSREEDQQLKLSLLVLHLDRNILEWRRSLQPHSQFPLDRACTDDASLPITIQRQRNILHVRFLAYRMHLHRQSLIRLLRRSFVVGAQLVTQQSRRSLLSAERHASFLSDQWSNFDAESDLTHISVGICVACAQLQINLVDVFQPLKYLGAWWWTFYCKSLIVA